MNSRDELPRSLGGVRNALAKIGVLDFERTKSLETRGIAAVLDRLLEGSYACLRYLRPTPERRQRFSKMAYKQLELTERN